MIDPEIFKSHELFFPVRCQIQLMGKLCILQRLGRDQFFRVFDVLIRNSEPVRHRKLLVQVH